MCRMVSGIEHQAYYYSIQSETTHPPLAEAAPTAGRGAGSISMDVCHELETYIEGTALLSLPLFHPSHTTTCV